MALAGIVTLLSLCRSRTFLSGLPFVFLGKMSLPPPPIMLLEPQLFFRAVSGVVQSWPLQPCPRQVLLRSYLHQAGADSARRWCLARGPVGLSGSAFPGNKTPVFPEAHPFASHIIPDVSRTAPHLSLWTCLPTLRSAVPVWRSSYLPSKSGPKASASLACQVRAGSPSGSCHTSPHAGLACQGPARGRDSHCHQPGSVRLSW